MNNLPRLLLESAMPGVEPATFQRANHYAVMQQCFADDLLVTARRYASAVYAMALCLCLSVCLSLSLSQVGVPLKWLNVGTRNTLTVPHDSPGNLVL